MSPRKTPAFLRALPTPERAPERERPEPSDAELVRALRAGDRATAEHLHDRCVSAIDQALYRVLGTRGVDHDDLVQTSFEQLVRSLAREGFLGECSLRTWASRIATHVALNSLRSRIRERRVLSRGELDEETTLGANEERMHQSRSELARVRLHLAALTPLHAEALVLHDVHGHSLTDIAALTGVSVAAAQSRVVRGRKELRSRLERDEKSSERRLS